VKIKMMVAALATTALAAGGLSAAHAEPGPGTSPQNPIVVDSPEDVPSGAIQTGQTTGEDCSTTTTWTLTVPATEETSHQEFRYLRDIPAVDEVSHQEWGQEERTRTFTPAVDEVSHQEFRYERTVKKYKTENKYMYRKYVKGVTQKKDSRGNWQDTGTFPFEIYNSSNGWGGSNSHAGAWGQESATDGSGGHSDYSSTVSGVRKHSTHYEYRKSELIDTRQVLDGTAKETSDWRTSPPAGDGWVKIDERKVVDTEAVPASYGPWTEWTSTASSLLSEPVLPADTDVHQYRPTGPVKIVETEAKPGYTEFYVKGGEPSRDREAASWILAEEAPEGWTQFDEQTVWHEDGTPEVVTYYAFNDGKECPPEEPPVEEPPTEEPPVDNPPTEEPPTEEPPVKKTPPVRTPDVPTIVKAGL